MLVRAAPYVREGYLTLLPQYRGADGGEGKDEFGGADVHDVLNLVPVARAQPQADVGRLVVFGGSRGGMMTFLALRAGLPARAAAIQAGAADLAATPRPEMKKVYSELIPGYPRKQVMRQRSAAFWAEEIGVPLLLLHGTADWRVPPTDTLAVAARLQQAGREYALHMFAGDDHGLTKNTDEVRTLTLRWFASQLAR
jgi:dipeptidyl aminopeptidase/acylaminoacyl peptidase